MPGVSGRTEVRDPASLNKAGSGAIELAGDTQAAGRLPVDETEAAAKDFGSANWDGGLGAALAEVAGTWSSQTSALVSACRSLGMQFQATGNNYNSVETRNHALMTNVSKSAPSASPFG